MTNRLNFFLCHLTISLLLSLLVIGLVFFIWYPSPLAVGVTQILFLMLAINIIVGPFLGFLVYKQGKKSLKFDLSVIIGLQIIALCYGLLNIERGRPVWIVYYVDRFELVRKNEIITEHIEQALPQFQKISWFKPQLAGVEFAKDANVRSDDLFAEVVGGISIVQKPERYVDFSTVKSQLKWHAISLTELNDYNDVQQVDRILSKYPQATAFLPLKENSVYLTVLINKEKGEIVKIVDLRPWK